MTAPLAYQRRLVDDDLDELMPSLPAIAIEGPRGVGKTRTALERARSVHRLDDPEQYAIARAEPARILGESRPVLIDEWQRLPEVWDLVRRAVDDGAPGGSFLLAGSALPVPPPTHSGAARIIRMRMRPLSLAERAPGLASVSLGDLLSGRADPIAGDTDWGLDAYVHELLSSGFPAIRPLPDRARRLQLSGYVDRLVDRDLPDDTGLVVRRPDALRRWLAAYAAASSTTATWETIRDAATAGQGAKPSRNAATSYRDALERVWLLDDVPAWTPTANHLRELGQAPKHQLVDPALAAVLLGADESTLLAGRSAGPAIPRVDTLLGALFESLATLCVRAYAARVDAHVKHLRTSRGRQEIDLIAQRADGRVVAIEVKLARDARDDDVRHLDWLHHELGDAVLDRVVITTGNHAYRRRDGVAVVPLVLLGP